MIIVLKYLCLNILFKMTRTTHQYGTLGLNLIQKWKYLGQTTICIWLSHIFETGKIDVLFIKRYKFWYKYTNSVDYRNYYRDVIDGAPAHIARAAPRAPWSYSYMLQLPVTSEMKLYEGPVTSTRQSDVESPVLLGHQQRFTGSCPTWHRHGL